ncbi:MAG: phosphoribosyl-ATP diphosphatase [Propylenella sp.]
MAGFMLENLAKIIARRAGSGDPASYTAKLAEEGIARCAKKLGEEAVETVIAAVNGDRAALTAEAADVLYHLLVVLHVAGIPYEAVTAELERRTAETGLQEKASRGCS